MLRKLKFYLVKLIILPMLKSKNLKKDMQFK
jgi:hypothetical protein